MKTNIRKILLAGLVFGFIIHICPFSALAQNAPVTTAATITNAIPGQVVVPVTVTGFAAIGSVTLTMDYEYSKLQFVSASLNPALSGSLSIGDNNLGNGKHRLILGWFGENGTLPDGSYLVNYTFNYISGTAPLVWFEMGPSCEYTDGNAIVLNDSPTSLFYINGLVQPPADKQLQLNLLLEGLYNTSTHKMNYARNAVANQFPGTTVEQVTVELRDAANYSNLVYTANNVNLDENGAALLTIPYALNGSYYIAVKHRNSINTVSGLPVSFSGNTIAYSFNDAVKAFGSNLKQASDGAWVIYGGDINQDDCIDANDLIALDNDAALFATGYIVTDSNGDGNVDESDLIFPGINAENFIRTFTP